MKVRDFIVTASITLFALSSYGQDEDVYRIEKLPISSKIYNDMSPVLTKDGILFCSDRKLGVVKDVRTFDSKLLYNIYFAEQRDSMDWKRSRLFTKDFSSLVNEGPFCFTPDDNQIYYTSNVVQGKRAGKRGVSNNSGIFIADRTGDGWSNIRPFEYNDPLWNVAHPYISSDGKYLFFASDMPGGEGGSDIYYCEWVDGKWTRPVSPGSEINSPDADLFPYFSERQELFFASDRKGGLGGLDLYSASLNYGRWIAPVILPEPINSSSDDFSYFLESGTLNGVFASNRGRNDDIYRFTSLIIRKNNCDPLVMDSYCYEFTEENAVRFDSLPFEYEWDFNDGTKAIGVTAEHCFENPGTYVVKLNVIDNITGEVQYNEVSYILDIDQTEQAFIASPDSCLTGVVITFDASDTYLPGWIITEYYWSFDDGTIARGISSSKSFSEPGRYEIQLIISSDPDASGNVREACVSKKIVVRQQE
ncbi:MAG: PKD domain-containing protein [Bacteroidales bacterium]|nr:PKD domain-containing protein [Bacteroidales bacterium]